MALPEWYKIPEVSPSDFLECMKPLYKVRSRATKNTGVNDPFKKAFMLGAITEEEWDRTEQINLFETRLAMVMGYFHQDLIGKFPGWKTLKQGHETGCDNEKEDGTVIMEVKNSYNTLNSGGGKHVIATLVKQVELGKKAILVQINCPNGKVTRFGAPSVVDVWNGQQVYEHVSGRKSFCDDLLFTMQRASSTCPTFDSLKSALGSA